MANVGESASLWIGRQLNRRGFLRRAGRVATATAIASGLALGLGQQAFAFNLCPNGIYCCENPQSTQSTCYCCESYDYCPAGPTCVITCGPDLCCDLDGHCS